ncbi:hypothetical protein FQR65_LT20802 [Abscondita terminalis]|nr:hypothetical protein FQR65_LT20802 [Abscondita terminalis]
MTFCCTASQSMCRGLLSEMDRNQISSATQGRGLVRVMDRLQAEVVALASSKKKRWREARLVVYDSLTVDDCPEPAQSTNNRRRSILAQTGDSLLDPPSQPLIGVRAGPRMAGAAWISPLVVWAPRTGQIPRSGGAGRIVKKALQLPAQPQRFVRALEERYTRSGQRPSRAVQAFVGQHGKARQARQAAVKSTLHRPARSPAGWRRHSIWRGAAICAARIDRNPYRRGRAQCAPGVLALGSVAAKRPRSTPNCLPHCFGVLFYAGVQPASVCTGKERCRPLQSAESQGVKVKNLNIRNVGWGPPAVDHVTPTKYLAGSWAPRRPVAHINVCLPGQFVRGINRAQDLSGAGRSRPCPNANVLGQNRQ